MSFGHICVDFLYPDTCSVSSGTFFLLVSAASGRQTVSIFPTSLLYMEEFNLMTYEEFKTVIARQVEQMLPQGASLKLQTICKNNGLKLDGLTITNIESNVSPTIYLNYYYEKQNLFPDFDTICRDIMLTYEHNRSAEHINADFFTDYNLISSRISYRLINYEKNKELLETVPHVRYLDLAIVFYCLLNFSENSSATILIHADHLKLWNINAAELYHQACQTAPELLPYDFRNINAVLSDTFGSSTTQPNQDIEKETDAFCPMYILTNSQKLYGASCLLYPRLLDSIAEKLNTDLFVLPSSIHEVILLPALNRSHCKELADMVTDINRTELAADEILSDLIYYYSRSEHALSICQN